MGIDYLPENGPVLVSLQIFGSWQLAGIEIPEKGPGPLFTTWLEEVAKQWRFSPREYQVFVSAMGKILNTVAVQENSIFLEHEEYSLLTRIVHNAVLPVENWRVMAILYERFGERKAVPF